MGVSYFTAVQWFCSRIQGRLQPFGDLPDNPLTTRRYTWKKLIRKNKAESLEDTQSTAVGSPAKVQRGQAAARRREQSVDGHHALVLGANAIAL